MAFNSLVIGSDTYVSIGSGVYSLSTKTFSDPVNQIKIAGARRAGRGAPVSFSVTKLLGKDVTEGTDTVRRNATVNVQVNVPDGFTATEIDTMLSDLSTWLDTTVVNRLLMGES